MTSDNFNMVALWTRWRAMQTFLCVPLKVLGKQFLGVYWLTQHIQTSGLHREKTHTLFYTHRIVSCHLQIKTSCGPSLDLLHVMKESESMMQSRSVQSRYQCKPWTSEDPDTVFTSTSEHLLSYYSLASSSSSSSSQKQNKKHNQFHQDVLRKPLKTLNVA